MRYYLRPICFDVGRDNPTFVYIEEWRDLVADGTKQHPANITLVGYAAGIRIIAAHEATHRFVGPHDPAIDLALMDGVGALSGGRGDTVGWSPFPVSTGN